MEIENIQQKESITLKKNAKGDMEWIIKVLDDDVEKQLIKIKRINKELQKEYSEEKK